MSENQIDWRVRWEKFFKLFLSLNILYRNAIRNALALEWERDYPDQGFGSSDFNHTLFNEFGEITDKNELIEAIVDYEY